jgi:zeta-carotene desaturase
MQESLDTDVLVLGGGVAGLTCAIGLRDSGARVMLAEREPLLGGRARSWIDEPTGDPIHIGPHVVTSYYPSFSRLLDLLGTSDRIAWQEPGLMYTLFDGARATAIRAPNLPAPLHFLVAMLHDPELGVRDVASNCRVTALALGLDEKQILALDRFDARTVLEMLGVRPAMMRRTWAFAAMSLMNVPLERCSAGSILRTYRHLVRHPIARVGFPRCGLGDLYAPAAQALLERGGHRVLTGVTAVELIGHRDRVTAVRFSDGRIVRARHVVSTLPPRALVPLLPERWRALAPFSRLPWFEPVPYVSVYLWLDRKITRMAFWARALAAGDLNCDFYDYSNIYDRPQDAPSLIGSNIIYAHRALHLSDQEIVARTFGELCENLPQAAQASIRHAVVNRIPLSVEAPLPGFEAHRPTSVTPIGGLWLAGDFTRTGLPSSLESAAASGWRAAEQIRRCEGQPRAMVEPLPPADQLSRMLAATAGRAPWPPALRQLLAGA